MEALQQDQDSLAQPGTDGELDLANDGNELEAQGTDASDVSHSITVPSSRLSLTPFRRSQQGKPPASSGIAQIHKSMDDANGPAPDPMNLDDFIMPNSIASPAGLSPSVPDDSARATDRTSALPIKTKNDAQNGTPSSLTPGSVPPPLTQSSRTREFDYVKRRVRKTSVDEQRVSGNEDSASEALHIPPALTILIRLESVPLNFRLKCLPRPCL